MKAETIYTWKKKSENDIQYLHTMRIWYTKSDGWNKEGDIMMKCNCGSTMHYKPEGIDYSIDAFQLLLVNDIMQHLDRKQARDINIFNSINNPVLLDEGLELLQMYAEEFGFRVNIINSNFDDLI